MWFGVGVAIAKDYAIPHALAAFDMMGATEAIVNARSYGVGLPDGDNPIEPFTKRDAFRACFAYFQYRGSD